MQERRVQQYFAHTMPGLERVAWTEADSQLQDATLLGYKHIRRRNGMYLMQTNVHPREMLRLRTIEDLFTILVQVPRVPWGREGLDTIRGAIGQCKAFRAHETLLLGLRRISPKHRVRYRSIVRITGKEQPYRRIDLRNSVERAIARATRGRWQAVRDGEQIELWVNMYGYDALMGIRLSDASMRHRAYQKEHLPASLRPSVAASMAWLTRPQRNNVFCDPMCGSGTIAIERAALGPARGIVAGDVADLALGIARQNTRGSNRPVQVFRWDARRTCLANASVNAIACNLPFGVQVGESASLPELYAASLEEMWRILTPRGRMVLLSAKRSPLEKLARRLPGIRVRSKIAVEVLGRAAEILVATKTR